MGAYNWERNREGTLGTRRDYSVGVNATWNIFSGFATRAAVTDAAFAYSSQLNNQLTVARKVEEEVRLAWQGVGTACDRRLLLDNAVSIAAEVHDARVRLRDAGRETIVNVLDAESELFNAEINLITSIYDEKLAVYRLAVSMGRDILVEEIDAGDTAGQTTTYEGRCAAPALEPAARTPAATVAPQQAPLDLPVNPFRTEPPNPAVPNPFAAPAPNPFEAPAPAQAPANPFAPPAPGNPFEAPPAQPAAPAGERREGAELVAPPGGRVVTVARTAPFFLTAGELQGFVVEHTIARRN